MQIIHTNINILLKNLNRIQPQTNELSAIARKRRKVYAFVAIFREIYFISVKRRIGRDDA